MASIARPGRRHFGIVSILFLVFATATVVAIETDLRPDLRDARHRAAELEVRLGPAAGGVAKVRWFEAAEDELERRVRVIAAIDAATPNPVSAFRAAEPVLASAGELRAFHAKDGVFGAEVCARDLNTIVRTAEAVTRTEGFDRVEIDRPRSGDAGLVCATIVFERAAQDRSADPGSGR